MPCDGWAGARAVGVELGAVRKEPRPCLPGTHLCGAGRASCLCPHSGFRAPTLPLGACTSPPAPHVTLTPAWRVGPPVATYLMGTWKPRPDPVETSRSQTPQPDSST